MNPEPQRIPYVQGPLFGFASTWHTEPDVTIELPSIAGYRPGTYRLQYPIGRGPHYQWEPKEDADVPLGRLAPLRTALATAPSPMRGFLIDEEDQ